MHSKAQATQLPTFGAFKKFDTRMQHPNDDYESCQFGAAYSADIYNFLKNRTGELDTSGDSAVFAKFQFTFFQLPPPRLLV